MKQREREQAELLYVEGQKTLAECREALDVSDKILRIWKAKGNWDKKRKEFLSRHTQTRENFEKLINDLTREIALDRKKGRRPSVSRLNTLAALQKRLDALREKRQEDAEKVAHGEDDDEKKPPLTAEHFLQIEREEMGLFAEAYRN